MITIPLFFQIGAANPPVTLAILVTSEDIVIFTLNIRPLLRVRYPSLRHTISQGTYDQMYTKAMTISHALKNIIKVAITIKHKQS